MEEFLNELTENEGLRAQFLAQSTMEGAYSVAKPYLSEMTLEEFSSEMTGLARNIIESKEISDAELESVSGGVINQKPWQVIATAYNKGNNKKIY